MLTSDLWSDDVDQTSYARRNLEAVRRGARVKRLFLLPEGSEAAYQDTIQNQLKAGVDVRAATNRLIAHVPQLEDSVLFKFPDGARAYTAYPVIDGSRRIRSGFVELSVHTTRRLEDAFQEAWTLAATPDVIFASSGHDNQVLAKAAPGTLMKTHFLAESVVSCEDAAEARGIPLTNELKTLVLRTSVGFVAAHLPGDGILSLRKVKGAGSPGGPGG